MTPAPFQIKGDKPEWALILDVLTEHSEHGTIITYEEIGEALGRPLERNRGPLYKAMRRFAEACNRWLEPMPKVGYRVIEANEHLDASHNRKKRARRQLQTMVRIDRATDLSRLSESEMARWDHQTRLNAALLSVAVNHENRLTQIETILRQDGKLD